MSETWEEAEARANRWDEKIAAAVGLVAAKLAPIGDEREIGEQRHLVPRLSEALRDLVGENAVATGRKPLVPEWLPDWDPLPGNVDLIVGQPPSPVSHPVVGVEVKSRTHKHKLSETPYDIFKMAALRRMPTVEAAYLVVAAPTVAFCSDEAGAPLFNTPENETEEWTSSYLIDEWTKGWKALLADSSGKPLRVPRTLYLQRVISAEVPAFPGWELRALHVDNAAENGQWLVFDEDGWPSGLDPDPWENGPTQIADTALLPADVPPPDCDEEELHVFALSCDGYAREGSLRNCRRIADEARRRWDQTGELPDDLRTLRSCLFFEQRRAHMTGYGFGERDDGRTLVYVHGLVEAVRRRVA